jgi:hypothetical protein
VDAPAALSLAAIGAAGSKRARVVVQPGDYHPLHIWVMVALGSGEGKTPVLRDVAAPLEAEDRRIAQKAAPEIARLESARRILTKRLHHLEGRCARASDESQRMALAEEAADLSRQIADIPVPSVPRLITEDATAERLVQLLAENQGRLALLSDEGNVLFGGLIRRSKPGSENMEPLLKAFSGAPTRVDRVGRPDVLVRDPALTIALAVQPAVLHRLLGTESFSGRGLLERFLYSVPVRCGIRDQSPPSLDDEAVREYRATIDWLLARDVYERIDGNVPEMVFDDRATMFFREFSAEIDIDPYSVSPAVMGWMNKLRTNTARIAGILHAADQGVAEPRSVIPAGTVERAIEIGRYFRAHAELTLGTHLRSEAETALLTHIQRNQLAVFRPHEAHRAMQARFRRIEDVLRVVALMQERGFVRPCPRTEPRGPGRPPLEYEVHPALLQISQ